jgi:hypothetical protein
METISSRSSLYRSIQRGIQWIIVWVSCAAGLQSALAESGVVAWKEQSFHADSAAKVFYFDRVETTGQIKWFHQGERRKGFEPGQAYDMVLLPGSLDELNRKVDSGELKSKYAKLVAFSDKYPAAKVMLKERLEQMRIYLESYDAAEVQVGQKWVPIANDPTPQGIQEVAPKIPTPAPAPSYLNEAVAIGVIYLVILMLLTLRRKRTLILLLLVLPFFVGFGWFTYKDRGVGWMKEIPIRMKAIYDRFGSK